MKVSKCSTVKDSGATTYTGKELETTAPEGVYKRVSTTKDNTRYVVLTGAYNNRCCLYIPAITCAIKTGTPSKTSSKFVRVENAEVIFEINEQ